MSTPKKTARPLRLSEAMEKVMKNLHLGLPEDHGLKTRSEHGGLSGTTWALINRGLINWNHDITPDGEAWLEANGYSPDPSDGEEGKA